VVIGILRLRPHKSVADLHDESVGRVEMLSARYLACSFYHFINQLFAGLLLRAHDQWLRHSRVQAFEPLGRVRYYFGFVSS